MARPCKRRRIFFDPNVKYFKPAGIPVRELEEVILAHEELEAVRLSDFEGLGQEESAGKMGISQPTFHRLLSSARKKLADAFVNGKAVRIEGGVYNMVGTQKALPKKYS